MTAALGLLCQGLAGSSLPKVHNGKANCAAKTLTVLTGMDVFLFITGLTISILGLIGVFHLPALTYTALSISIFLVLPYLVVAGLGIKMARDVGWRHSHNDIIYVVWNHTAGTVDNRSQIDRRRMFIHPDAFEYWRNIPTYLSAMCH